MRRLTVLVVATLDLAFTADAADIDPDLLGGLKARCIGPAGMSGRIADIQAVEADPDVVWAGAATGGVWKSTNGGVTWKPLFDEQKVAAIGAIAIFQPNPEIVWVGTGESNVRNSASVGNGVYRTLDGGKTWTHVGLDGSERIARIVTHPTDPDVAWVAALGREWGENPERGVFKTTDGGATWKKVLYVDERTGAADLAIDPSNPNKLFAALWQFRRWPFFFRSGGPGSGLHVTIDGGATWKRLQEEDGLPKGVLGRIGVALCRSHPEVVYALIEAEKSALLRSADGGRTFTTVNDEPNISPRPFYFADIRVDPEWPNRLYRLDYGVRVSDDGGKTFRALEGARALHGDFHAMWIDPADGRRMYTGDDGGIGESRDRGATMRFVTNLPLAQFYHVAVDDALPYNVMGGMQDNGSWRGPAAPFEEGGIRNHMWRLVGGGDGYNVLPDPAAPGTGYSMWQGGNLMRFDLTAGTIRHVRPPTPEGVKLRFNWNSALALDPFAPGTIYYGSQFVHASTDRGESWRVISPDLTTDNPAWQKQDDSGGLTPDVTAAENYCTLLTIAPSPIAKGVIWTGSDDGRIHVTRDGGATWTSVEAGLKGVPANTWIPHLEPSRFDAAEAFVVLEDHRRSNWAPYVYRTRDFGATWTSLVTPALRGWALVIVQDPVDRDLLFLGTEFGLNVTLDGGRSWLPLTKAVPTVSVMDMAIQARDADLVIGTHGRAAWVLDDLRPLRELSAATLAEPLHLYPGAPALQHTRAAEAGGFGFGATEFRGANRPYGAILTYSLNLPDLPLQDAEKERARRAEEHAKRLAGATWGPEPTPKAATEAEPGPEDEKEPKVEILVADASGKVVRTLKGPARLGVNQAVWDLRRDAFRQFPRLETSRPDEEPRGPEVPPATYTVTVRFRDREARGTVEVRQDPRAGTTPADWQRRTDAILAVGRLRDAAVEAVERVRAARADVDAVIALAKADAARAERARREAGGAPPARPEEPALAKAGAALKEKLTTVERLVWSPREMVGIVAENDPVSKLFMLEEYLTSTWAPPSESHLAHLRTAESLLAKVLAEVDALLAGEVGAFRARADAAGIRLLAPAPPVAPPPAFSPGPAGG